MSRYRPLCLVLLLAACSGGAPEAGAPAPAALAPIRLSQVGDSILYLERTHTLTLIDRPSDTLEVESTHDAIIHVVRTAPDSLEAFYEHLILRFETPTQSRAVDTRAMIGPRFRLHEDGGRIQTVHAPAQPAELRQLTDLRRQFDDFFLRIPRTPIAVGSEWVDTVNMAAAEGEATTARNAVTRYTVRADTVIDGIDALVIDYAAVLENRLRTAPTTEGVLTSSLTGEEEGTFVFSPAREVMLRRSRIAVLEGEIVIEGGLQTMRFPQAFSYESTIELLPPHLPGSRPAPAPVRPAEPVPEI